jgi:arylsulfatase A-like enzyme
LGVTANADLPIERQTSDPADLAKPGTALLTIVAIVCLTLEAELLQQIDSLRLYLNIREIAIEAGIVLLFSIPVALCWWLFVSAMGKFVGPFLPSKRVRPHLLWSLWIGVPLAYLLLDLFQDLKLELLPHWHAGTTTQLFVALIITAICVILFSFVDWRTLQSFCHTRMVPIACVHLAIAVVAVPVLWFHGIWLFHDYEQAAQPSARRELPDIYLITIDTLRADGTSLYGYSRVTTPNLDKFAQRSFIFDYNFANSNFTTPSTSSIETGKLPWSHRVFQGGGFLRGKNLEENLPNKLKERGYYTAMISSNFLATPFRHRTQESYAAVEYPAPIGFTGLRLRASNFLNCNAQFTTSFSLMRFATAITTVLDRTIWRDRYPSPSEDVFDRSRDLLKRHTGAQPVFLWTHILPPHDPYWVPLRFRGTFVSKGVRNYAKFTVPDIVQRQRGVAVQELRDAYDEMILYADHSVGEFLAWLDQTGRLDRSIVIISSDHGEMFDHGRLTHGGLDLYNGLIRVPLLIHLPGQSRGVHIAYTSQEADLLSTVLDLVSAPAPKWSDGTSLKPLLEGGKLEDRYIFSMNLEPNRIFAPITKGTVAVMDSEYKFVRYLDSFREQLYQYRVDSNEEHDLIHSEPEVAARMRKVLLDKIEEVNRQFSGNP